MGAHRNHEADRPPDERADARVEQVLERDILGVLGTHSAGFEKREATLEKEAEEARKQDPRGVRGLINNAQRPVVQSVAIHQRVVRVRVRRCVHG